MTQKEDKSKSAEYTSYGNHVIHPDVSAASLAKKPKRSKKQPKNRGLIWH